MSMTNRERILALDAAANACEDLPASIVGFDLAAAVSLLQDALDAYLGTQKKHDDFDDFLKEQRAAVGALNDNPAIYGAA